MIKVKSATKEGFEIAEEGDAINLSMPQSKTRRGRVGKKQAQTLDTQSNQAVVIQVNPSTESGGKQYSIRRLTPTETERLQGFSDNHTAMGNYDGLVKPISKSQRYKLCGNAVTVDVVEMVSKKLFELINK